MIRLSYIMIRIYSIFHLSVAFCLTLILSMTVSAQDHSVIPGGFSLHYDVKASETQEKHNWEPKIDIDAQKNVISTVSPDGKLEIRKVEKIYNDFPILEYSITLKNRSETEMTDVVNDFQSLSYSYPVSGAVELRTLYGSHYAADDFTPIVKTLCAGNEEFFSTPSGRSSNEVMPFLEMNIDEKNGYFFAIGWTGGWKATFTHDGDAVKVRAGMLKTNFRLAPSESVRMPSILVAKRSDMTRAEFQTLLHRFMLQHKVPRDAEGKVISPILAVACGGGNKTPEMMLNILKYVRENQLPFDTYWIDAGWYGAPHEDELYSNCGPNWYRYVGDWRVNTTTHPTGTLLPIADAVHAEGMKLLLWFEPERVHADTPIQKEHPEFCHGNLLDYGNPVALAWIQDAVYGMIAKHNINVYRQDFNMDPGGIWAGIDAENPERVGLAEAKHITGMYQFLDEMRRRFPGILQENCASGGRRIDFEMISRAHTYCRSDYFIGQKPNDQAFILGQNTTRNTLAFLPFQGCEFNCVPVGDDYGAWSIISSGTVITPSDFDGGIIRRTFSDEETRWFQKTFGIANRIKPFWSGDFYPLTEEETSATNDVWCGWQLHDAEKEAGFAILFRRGNAPDETREMILSGLDSATEYEVEWPLSGEKKILTGAQLATRTVTLAPRSVELIIYQKK
ncbi:MAG: alpha-galactosidase [Planctomycetia bacterium]|nr:alpha-galactosidase [Planctomycetia bacterium]